MDRFIKAYDGDSNSTLQARRRVRDALRQAKIPQEDIERLLVSYASDIQQIVVPPPPLPPRVNDSDLATAQDFANVDTPSLPRDPGGHETHGTFPKKGSLLGPNCRVLVVDSSCNGSGVAIQAFLEWLRAWTASQGGPWIFKSVSRVLRRFLDHERSHRRGRNESDCIHESQMVETVFRDLQEVSAPPLLPQGRRTDCFLADNIAGTVHGREILGTTLDAWKNFDYIFLSSEQDFKILNSEILQGVKAQSSRSREGEDNQIKHIYDLGEWEGFFYHHSTKEQRKCMYNTVSDLLGIKLPNECLNGASPRTNLKTEFAELMVDSIFDSGEVERRFEECLRMVEQASGCRLHPSGHHCRGQSQRLLLIVVGPDHKPTKAISDVNKWISLYFRSQVDYNAKTDFERWSPGYL